MLPLCRHAWRGSQLGRAEHHSICLVLCLNYKTPPQLLADLETSLLLTSDDSLADSEQSTLDVRQGHRQLDKHEVGSLVRSSIRGQCL